MNLSFTVLHSQLHRTSPLTSPPCEIVEVDGRRLVVAEVPPAPADRRPVYVTAQGVSGGSYLRGGDGDRHMTESEIAMVMAARVQPLYDREPVDGSAPGDLDDEAIRRTLRRVRSGFPKLAQSDDATILFRLGITTGPSPDSSLTLAGLLTYGQFPQQFFPQLMVPVVVPSADSYSGTRFLDNQTVRGSIPEMVETTVSVLRRNLAVRAVISERGGRVDEVEYPLEAVREAVVNALMHRDYSPVTRGTQVQVELFPDRLVVRSFLVTMARSELLNSDVRNWIAGLHAHLSTPAHEIALAMLRGSYLTNEMLRQWGVDRIAAGQVLRDLVDQGLAIKEGGRRYAQYVLDPAISGRTEAPDLFAGLLPDVGAALRTRGEATAGELAAITGLQRNTLLKHLRALTESGAVVAVGAAQSPRRRYRWASPASTGT